MSSPTASSGARSTGTPTTATTTAKNCYDKGNGPLQDRLSGARRRCRAIVKLAAARASRSGGTGPHQEGQPLPRRLRPGLQQALRGSMHPRHDRSGRRHRRGQEIPCRAGSARRDALYPARRRRLQPSERLGTEDRHHRRWPGRSFRRLLSGHARL